MKRESIGLDNILFKSYHVPLTHHVIDIRSQKLSEDFLKGNLEESDAKNFRDTFREAVEQKLEEIPEEELKKLKQLETNNPEKLTAIDKFILKNKLDYEPHSKIKKTEITDGASTPFWSKLSTISLNISAGFKKLLVLDKNPQLSNIEEFTEELQRLINIKKPIINIQQGEKRGNKILYPEIAKLAGHILVEIDRNNEKVVVFSDKFLNGEPLEGNLKDFRDELMKKLKVKNFDDFRKELIRYTFKITGFQTCKESAFDTLLQSKPSLPSPQISDEEVEEFLDKLVFAVNQPNEEKLSQLINEELGEEFNLIDTELITDNFQDKMLSWMKEKQGENRYLSESDIANFFKEARERISQLVLIGPTSEYIKRIDETGIKFKPESLPNDLKMFLKQDSSPSVIVNSIFNFVSQEGETLLGSIKVRQILGEIEKYKKDGSYIFVQLSSLSRLASEVIKAFKKEGTDLLIVECKLQEKSIDDSLCDNLLGILKKNKKVLLISSNKNEWVEQFKKISFLNVEDQTSFGDLTEESQKKLLEKKVKFQGSEIFLNQIVFKENTELTQLLPLADLMKGKKIEIGKPIPISYGYDPDFYIDRTFNQQITIKEKIFDDFESSDDSKSNELTDFVAKNQQKFEQFCQQYPDKNVHWLQQESEQWLWKQSKGSLNNLRKYIDTSQSNRYTPENTKAWLEKPQQHRIMVISDTAGMGKSTVLTRLSQEIKELNTDHWVVRIDLNDHTATLDKFSDSEKATKFLINDLLKLKTAGLERSLFNQLLKEQKVVLMFDGFDEISPAYKEKVIRLLKKLKETAVGQLWVTTRPQLEETLEDALQHLSYTLEPFSEANQIDFLVKFWAKNLGKDRKNPRLRIYAEKLVQKLTISINDKEKTFTGIPLQLRMLSEIFERKQEKSEIPEAIKDKIAVVEEGVKEFCASQEEKPNFTDKIDLLSLYINFIYKKYYEIFGKEKSKSETLAAREQLDELYLTFIEKHQKWALYTLFGENNCKEFFSEDELNSIKLSMNDIKVGKEKKGIIDQVIDDKPHFIHRTFAEYFAADFLAKNIKSKESSDTIRNFIIKDIFIKPDYQVVRRFINDIWSRDGLPSEEILNIYGKEIDALWNKNNKDLILSGEGVWDGTILAQAVREGNSRIVDFLFKSLINFRGTLKDLLLYKDEYGSILHRAGWETEETDILDKILEMYEYEMKNKEITEDNIINVLETKDKIGRTLFHRAVKWGRKEVLHRILDSFKDFLSAEVLLIKDKKGQSVWQRAGRSGNVDMLDKLLEWSKEKNIQAEKIKDELLTKDKSLTTFNQAVKWGNIDILNKIVELKTDYIEITTNDLIKALSYTDDHGNKKGRNGRTAWHRAVYDDPNKIQETQRRNHEEETSERKYSRIDVLNKLIEFCEKAKLTNKEIKELLEKGNQKGNTALHLAVKKNLKDETKWLSEKMKEYGADLNIKNDKGQTALHWAADEKHWDIAVLLLNHSADINDLNAEQCNALKAYIEQGSDANRQQLLEKIEQRLSALPAEAMMEVDKQAKQVGLEPMDIEEAGPSCGSRRRRDLRGCGEEGQEGRVFPYEPLQELVSEEQRQAARLHSQLALAVTWQPGESADNWIRYQRYLGDILEEGAVNQSPREQGLLREHYQRATQFFAQNPKGGLLTAVSDDLAPAVGRSVWLQNGQQSWWVFNEGARYQLYSPDFNYRQRFQTRLGVSWSALSGFMRAFFAWKSGSREYHPLVLKSSVPESVLTQLRTSRVWRPDKLAPDRVLLAERQHGLIEGIPATTVRELISVKGQVIDWTALHADFFQTAGIQLRLDKLHQVLPELSDEQRRHLVRLVNRYDWAADNSILERCSAEERVVLADYQQRAMAELKQAETITPERLSELSWQSMALAIEKQPVLPTELKQPVLDNLKAMRSSTTRRAWAKGMATQALFFLPDMIRAANTGQVGGLTSTAGMLAADGGVNHLYGRLLERLAPTLSETRLAILQKLPVTSPVFKALTVYSIVELTQQLATLPVDSPQRQTIKHRLGEQYVTIGIMAAELLGLETGPLWIGLMAEQLIFEAITFRQENQLDIPFWEALIMSLGFEQNKLQHIVEERQLVDVNLATVDNINTQANPPYGWVLVKVPFLGRQVWQPIDEWQVPTEVYQTVTRQPDSLVRALTVTREAAGFRQVDHYEAGKSVVIPGGFASVPRGRWLNTVWYQSTYAAQAAAIEVQLAPQNYQSRQEDNVFLRTVTLQGTNTTYQCAAAVEGQQYRYVTTHRPLRITGKGLAALYRGNTSSTAAQRNLYLGFDPREGDITLYIPSSGLYRLNNLTAPTGVYHLTVQVGNKNYPESIILPPRGGRLYIEDRSQQLNSLYFIRRQSAPVYLYDETSVTRVAFETVESPAKGFIIWGRVTNILQWHAAPTASNVTLQAPPYQYNLCVKGAVAAPAQPPFYQVNTLCLQGKKQSLQLQLTQQRIANVLMLSAQQVEVLSARGEDAYHSGIYLYSTVTHFDITVVGHLQIMQEQTHLFVIGENPDNTPAIHYTKNPGMPYQLTLATLQPVIDTLHRPNPQERHFSAPGVRFSWVAGEPAAVLQIVGRYQGQSAQLLLERDNATLSQSAFHQPTRTLVVFHFTDSVALDPQLRLQQVLPANHTGPGLQFQSPQGDEVLHYFEHDRFTINGIHYQVHGKRLYATGAESGVIEGKQLIRDRHPGQGVGIRIHSSLNQSVLARDNQTWSINQLKLHQLPERTLIYFEHQTFPWQALQETPQHPHRHHHQSRHRRQIPNVASSAQRPTSWITNLWKGLLGRFPTASSPPLPQPPVSLSPPEYTAHHLQGGLQLLDLVIRKWTGKKYSPPTLTIDFDTDDNRRTMASQLAYAAQCPAVATLKQSLATENHESHATTPQEPWLAYPLPTTDTHNLTRQLT